MEPLRLLNKFFLENINDIEEVSIGHALICDTFEYGLEKTIKKYLSLTKFKWLLSFGFNLP